MANLEELYKTLVQDKMRGAQGGVLTFGRKVLFTTDDEVTSALVDHAVMAWPVDQGINITSVTLWMKNKYYIMGPGPSTYDDVAFLSNMDPSRTNAVLGIVNKHVIVAFSDNTSYAEAYYAWTPVREAIEGFRDHLVEPNDPMELISPSMRQSMST